MRPGENWNTDPIECVIYRQKRGWGTLHKEVLKIQEILAVKTVISKGSLRSLNR